MSLLHISTHSRDELAHFLRSTTFDTTVVELDNWNYGSVSEQIITELLSNTTQFVSSGMWPYRTQGITRTITWSYDASSAPP